MGHLYTTSTDEVEAAIGGAYESEGVAGYVFKEPRAVSTPLFRADHPTERRHVYTTDESEYNQLVNASWVSRGVECYVLTDNIAGARPFFRLFNPGDGDHFYTADPVERDAAVTTFGYVLEGFEGFILPAPAPGASELFRMLQVYDSYLRVNLIAVGGDTWTAAQQAQLTRGFAGAAALFRQTGIRLRNWGRFFIPDADAGGYLSIGDVAEASALTDDWTVPNPALDLFCVPAIPGTVAGWSPEPGPCDKNAKGMDGVVVELSGSLGLPIAHEIGHYLGIAHDPTPGNVMGDFALPGNTNLSAEQAAKMKKHCFVRRYY